MIAERGRNMIIYLISGLQRRGRLSNVGAVRRTIESMELIRDRLVDLVLATMNISVIPSEGRYLDIAFNRILMAIGSTVESRITRCMAREVSI